MHSSFRSLLAGLALAGVVAADLPAITIKGSKFFYENGTQFFIKGVAYQQGVGVAGTTGSATQQYIDPLSDETICARDIPFLQKLQTNTIRTYAIDPTADHSGCMKLLQDAGIYVVSDLSEPNASIDRKDPQWTTSLFARYQAVVDELQQYPNVIGFFAGNEVSNDNMTTDASAFVKAAVRDTKAYIKAKKYRPIGVGYAANDDLDIRTEIAHYFNCGPADVSIDFWGYNIYSWCQQSSLQKSGYDVQVEFFSNYSVPVFFAEYGCNVPDGADGRIWEETTALYSDDMTNVISGGIVYMFYEETNDFGLVSVKSDKVSTMKNFAALSTVIAKVDPSATAAASYNPTNSPAACPGISDTWKVNGESLPPTPDQSLCTCMWNSLGCVPSDGLSVKSYPDIFSYVCGLEGNMCAGIMGNAALGVYGAYGMCNSTEQLGYVLDQYYQSQNGAAASCDFSGKAVTKNAANGGSACSAALASAASVNAAAATATAPVTGVDGTSNGSDGGGGDNGNIGARDAQLATLFTVGDLAIGAYLGAAVLAGAGLVLL